VELLGFGPKKKEKWEMSDEEKTNDANQLKAAATECFKAKDPRTTSAHQKQTMSETNSQIQTISETNNISITHLVLDLLHRLELYYRKQQTSWRNETRDKKVISKHTT
jgi:hypothetical protein